MSTVDESCNSGWNASYLVQQKAEEVAMSVTAATVTSSPRPSAIFSSKDDNSSSPLKRLQHHVSKVFKGLSQQSVVKHRSYNPEILTSQKRQWASFQLQSLDHRLLKEPSRLFESMVVAGLHPGCDVQALEKQYFGRKSEGSGRFRDVLNPHHHSRIEPSLEPQVLFVYPPEKQIPLKYKDLLSFCFPTGVEVQAVERTPSMSEINEIFLSQEHLKQSELSFIFRLQVAGDSTLYGCCMLVEEPVKKPSKLFSMIFDKQIFHSHMSRRMLTTHRCYCILSRLPFFELHFGVLNSIFMEERLEKLTSGIDILDLGSPKLNSRQEYLADESTLFTKDSKCTSKTELSWDETAYISTQILDSKEELPGGDETHPNLAVMNSEMDYIHGDFPMDILATERHFTHPVSPLFQNCRYESSDSSCSFQGSPSEDKIFRSYVDDTEAEEASISGQDGIYSHGGVIQWAKANNYGSLQVLCEYYQLHCPSRGSTIKFQPLEHLHPLEFHRPDETTIRISGSEIDLGSCTTRLEFAEVHTAFLAEEEATALSVWTVACICGSLRLEHVLTIFAGALLEKQIVIVCSNLGILSALVLSILPLIRPFQWQSLFMPVLPTDMLDFLDAPVPYIVGIKSRTADLQFKLTNVMVVDANRNQVKSPTLPQLPQHKDLFSSLSPYHAKLVGESYLGRKRPVYECTEIQVEAARGFISVLRSYLDSLCSNLRSHTITNVQSNNDKVSLLLKESFIESFSSRDRPFLKLLVDTQLFSVYTDLVLSVFQRE